MKTSPPPVKPPLPLKAAEEHRAALDVAHGADDQRSVLGHVAVEGHARAAGDGDIAAGAVRRPCRRRCSRRS